MKEEKKTRKQIRNVQKELLPEIEGLNSVEESSKSKEETLYEIREKHGVLFQQSMFYVFLSDLGGRFLDANNATLRLLGYTREEIPSLDFRSLLEEDQLATAYAVLDSITQTGRPKEITQFKLRKKNGEFVWVEAEAVPLLGNGEPYGMIGIARDITDRMNTGEELKQKEERFRELAELLPEVVFEMDTLGVVTFINRKAFEISGYTQEDFENGFEARTLIVPEERDRVVQNIVQLMQGEEIGVSEYTACRKDGSRFPVMIRTTPIWSKGSVVGLRGIIFDITERKQMEEELRRQSEHLLDLVGERTAELRRTNEKLREENAERREVENQIRKLNEQLEQRVKERTAELEKAYEELQKLSGMKDSFLSLVSHELRTPLTSIRSFSEILLNYAEEDPKVRNEFLGIIHAESERLTRLINDVLDLSKIEAGSMAYHDDLLSMDEVIHAVAKTQLQLLKEKALHLNLDLPPEPIFVNADRDRIHQVVSNLLGNAIKFSHEEGEITIRIESFFGKRTGEASEWIKISVSDQGIGVDERDHDFIFEKFFQSTSDTLTNKPKGTGLGLPICKEIVSHYGGNVWLESRRGEGSSFFFTLPVTKMVVRKVEGAPLLPEQKTKGEGKTILVVDDNPNIRRLLCYQLQKRGYTVMEASDGAEALDLARKTTLDLITLDLVMPMMNGYDVLSILREDPLTREIPVLVLSMVESRGKGILQGANDYLPKPFQEGDLIKKVRALLGEGKRTVLVVDDNPGVRESLCLQLEERGYPVRVARDGEEALDLMKTQVPDLVILDLIMPRMNGYEVLKWIRSQPHIRQLPVIILSSCKLSDEQGKLVSQMSNAFVKKSEDLSSLFEEIDSILLSSDS